MSKYVNLHTHSHYSLLDGLPKIGDLVKRAKSLDMPGLAITDHGVMYGAVEFYQAAQKEGIRPIIGVEAYLALEHRSRKQSKLDDNYYHLILLAENNEGYKNLMKLVSISHLEGFYYKPRIDKESLREHSKGIIALTGCLAGEIPRLIQADKPFDEVRSMLDEYVSIFGENNVFLEVQHHPSIPDQMKVNDMIKELSRSAGIPRVATLDCHYLHPDDAEAQDALVCVSTGKLVEDTKRLDMRGIDLSMRSAEQVAKEFPGDPEVLETSIKIAERCDAGIDLGNRYFPAYEIPDNKDPDAYLRDRTHEGLAWRYKGREVTPEIHERIDYELQVIKDKGFPTYFLIVADFVIWMRERGIVTTTRGSAAGCMVSYCLGITNVNPIDFSLPFERFLNPLRPSAPDIDVDIADNRRQEVIEYVTEKYGQDKVAQIITFGKMLARAAVRDVGRVLGVPYAKCDQIAKIVPPPKQGFPMPIEKALETVQELKDMYDSDPETRKIIDLVKKVEGSARHSSIHAAGVVISPTAMTDFTPVQHDVDGAGMVTQYDMHACEEVGLVKMDFLGIRNLSILGNAVEIITKKYNVEIDLDNLPLDDKKTFELLAKGETVGLFQVGGSGMTAYLKELKPTTIYDIAAMIALYRPGPMENIPEYIRRKNNPALVQYPDPRLSEVLNNSYGILTYQDDVLLTAITIAGYDWGEVDKLRKAIGKKIPEEMAAQEQKFKKGIVELGGTPESAETIWDLIKPFAAYGFNKAHAASYALVTYQTAYLKANYPAEFMAAVLTAESHDLDKVAEAVEECGKMGIKVSPPDINESFKMFAVLDQNNIRWALTAVKNVGHDVVDAIVRERKENGQFSSFQNFVNRMPSKYLNRKSIESLICCGAFDNMGERNTLLANLERILDAARTARKNIVEGQSSLFGSPSSSQQNNAAVISFSLAPAEPATQDQKLNWEKDLLGMYVTSHPLEEIRPLLVNLTPTRNLSKFSDGAVVAIGGVVNKIHKITTRKGEPMAFVTFEDLTGTIECICFPKLYAQHMNLIDSNSRLLVIGKISDKDGDNKILLEDLKELTEENVRTINLSTYENKRNFYRKDKDLGGNGAARPVAVAAPAPAPRQASVLLSIPENASQQIFAELKSSFEACPGDIQIVLSIPGPNGQKRQVTTQYKVAMDAALKTKIKDILSRHHNPAN